MAANEPDAATGFVGGWEFKDITWAGLQRRGPAMLLARTLLAPIHARGSALKTLGGAQVK
jgi:hypothetical protein